MTEEKKQTEALPPVSFEEFSMPDYAQWKAEAEAALKGAPFDKKMFTQTFEGIRLEPLYTAENVKGLSAETDLPGEFPFRRGVRAAGSAWKIAQACSPSDPKEACRVQRQELDKGATTVHPVLDAASLCGRDLPEEGKRGIAMNALEDWEAFLDGIDLRAADLHMHAGASSVPQLAMLAAWARAHSIKPSELRGCIGADPLAAAVRSGSLPRPLDELYDEMAHSILWCEAQQCPLKTILVSGTVYGESGANAVQESAFALAEAAAFMRAMLRRGIDPDTVCRHMRFSVALGANFFMEIARLRALRLLWANIAQAFGCSDESCRIDVFARTSPFTLTEYDPYVNILRTATQTFSGAVGGVDEMQAGCFDEAVRPSTEQARRIARNQQIMLQSEFDLISPIDPAGGSWYVETLTSQVESACWELFQKIEAAGGMYAALRCGFVQTEIQTVLHERF
ncbi:MAG: acyl-CoA mutase large subunit family protein, partial [Pyramidobacter sp.]|nr:acyl-CoA mutase large subunit family protein [Pyramidobacter sp.]